MTHSLEVVSVVARTVGKHGVEGAEKGSYGLVTPVEGVGAVAEEDKAYGHVDGHVVAVMHFNFKPLSQYSERAECLNIARPCHDHAEREGEHTKTSLNRGTIDLILCLWFGV